MLAGQCPTTRGGTRGIERRHRSARPTLAADCGRRPDRRRDRRDRRGQDRRVHSGDAARARRPRSKGTRRVDGDCGHRARNRHKPVARQRCARPCGRFRHRLSTARRERCHRLRARHLGRARPRRPRRYASPCRRRLQCARSRADPYEERDRKRPRQRRAAGAEHPDRGAERADLTARPDHREPERARRARSRTPTAGVATKARRQLETPGLSHATAEHARDRAGEPLVGIVGRAGAVDHQSRDRRRGALRRLVVPAGRRVGGPARADRRRGNCRADQRDVRTATGDGKHDRGIERGYRPRSGAREGG